MNGSNKYAAIRRVGGVKSMPPMPEAKVKKRPVRVMVRALMM